MNKQSRGFLKFTSAKTNRVIIIPMTKALFKVKNKDTRTKPLTVIIVPFEYQL